MQPMSRTWGYLASFSLLFAVFTQALNPIKVQGQDFVDTVTGDRFQIIGVDYQPGGSDGFDPSSGKDALSDSTACLRDAAIMQRLGFNTIRTYNVDPSLNHDECVSIFNEAGMYILLDVNSPLPGDSININDPQGSYTLSYLRRVFAVLDAFRGYPNTLGFFSANELVNDDPTGMRNPPYIRAVSRDIKQYLSARGGRAIPVGYSAADFRDTLYELSAYLQCSIPDDGGILSRSDFIGLNSYSWCGDATFESSTYAQLAEGFGNTTIPVFFSEYGCIKVEPRTFTEVHSLYSTQMSTWSGGLVYEWTQEENGYGLVQINDDGSVTLLIDYQNLQTELQRVNLTQILTANQTANNLQPPDCGPSLIPTPGLTTDFTIPDQPRGVADLISTGGAGRVGSTVHVTATTCPVAVTAVGGGTTLTDVVITRVTSANVPNTTGGAALISTGAAPAATLGVDGIKRVVTVISVLLIAVVAV